MKTAEIPRRYFFFDTETTGLPRSWNAPLEDLDNWPRMVQLAWIVADETGTPLREVSRIIRPDGFSIPRSASDVHGITTEIALERGIPLSDALAEAALAMASACQLVAHNIAFDEKVLSAEFLRLGLPDPLARFRPRDRRCTMRESTDWCAIPGRYCRPKFPNLTELHVRLFGKPFDGAHDALADVRACESAFYELRKRGVMA